MKDPAEWDIKRGIQDEFRNIREVKFPWEGDNTMSDYEEIEEAEAEAERYDAETKEVNDAFPDLVGGIKSSGERRDFGTGAHRDSNTAVHKGRMDLIPASALHRFAAFMTIFDTSTLASANTLHSIACYNEAMQSMYLWLEGERSQEYDGGLYGFDHLSNALFSCQNIMHMAEDIPLWCPSVSPEYKEMGPRYDRISPLLLKRVSVHYQLGGINYGDRNWELGMPVMVTWDSATRHLRNWIEKEMTEDHMAAFAWNIMCTMHTIQMVQIGLLPDELYAPPIHRNIKIAHPDTICRIEGHEEDF